MSAAEVVAFIGLGSNLDRPEQQVREALVELGGLPRTRVVRHSALYQSAPHGPAGQPDYVNAVAMIGTGLDAHSLLDRLQALEQAHGRVRGIRWGPRTLDLDLLLFDDQVIRTERLHVPHPQLHRRPFVLVPLHEIAPRIEVPGLGPLEGLLHAVSADGVRPLTESDDAR